MSNIMEVNGILFAELTTLTMTFKKNQPQHLILETTSRFCVPGYAVSGGCGVLALHGVASSPSSDPGGARA